MKSNVEILIGVAITSTDWNLYESRLMHSLSNLRSVFGDGCIAYIVIQDESFEDEMFYKSEIEWVYISKVSTPGVSNARNLCIEKSIELRSTYVIFHDATIYWSLKAAQFVYEQKEMPTTPRGNVIFDELSRPSSEDFGDCGVNIVKADPMYNPYVWSYLLRVDGININRFDINYGPGVNTRYKSGEDAIFLFDYFARNDSVIVSNDKEVAIYHPPRPADFSKHLLYAYGQGALFRELIKRHFSFKLLVDSILFFGNAFFRCILLKKNAFSILLNRLKGFIGV